MTDPAEDFGAGLLGNQPPQPPIAPAQVAQPAQPSTNPIYDHFRERFQLPDDVTADVFDDYLVNMSHKATSADEVSRKYEELQAQIAAASIATPAAQPEATPAQQAAVRRWEIAKADPQLRQFVKDDPSGFGFVPLNPLNPAHLRAAETLNGRANQMAQFSNALFEDPYATAAELVEDRLRALEEKWQKQLEETQKQLTPLTEQVAMTAAQRQTEQFMEKNAALLFNADNTFTPLAADIDWVMKEFNISAEEAMAKVLPRHQVAPAATPPAAPPRQAPLSKVARQPQPEKPARFIDNLSAQSRMPVDQPDFDPATMKKRPTMADLQKKFNIPPM